jgi:hypothetical protein
MSWDFYNFKRALKLFARLHEKRRNKIADKRLVISCLISKEMLHFIRKIVKFDDNSSQQKAAEKKVLEL